MSGVGEGFPGATFRPVWFAAAPQLFAEPPLGWILHVAVGDGSLFPYFDSLQAPNRKASTLWVGKDGRCEQYLPASREPWAQAAGNSTYWAVETEGFPSEALTSEQVDTLARWHIWSGTADRVATAPGERGIGTHSMGGAAWGLHDCPGPIRSRQRTDILARVAQLRAPQPDPPAPAGLDPLGGHMFVARSSDLVKEPSQYLVIGGYSHHIASPAELRDLLAKGLPTVTYPSLARLFVEHPASAGTATA